MGSEEAISPSLVRIHWITDKRGAFGFDALRVGLNRVIQQGQDAAAGLNF